VNEKTAENLFLFIAKAFNFPCAVCLACVRTTASDNYFLLFCTSRARAYLFIFKIFNYLERAQSRCLCGSKSLITPFTTVITPFTTVIYAFYYGYLRLLLRFALYVRLDLTGAYMACTLGNIRGDDMAKKHNETLSEVRNHLVVKRNDLIQKSRHQMDLQEQKIILYMISKIKPSNMDFTEQVFSIAEFCRIIGADDDNGGNYEHIKKTLGKLLCRFVWVTSEDGSERSLRWVDKVVMNKRSGIVKLKIDDDLKPFLLDLQENFTQYSLIYTLAMRSQYSTRLYELLKSYQYKKYVIFDMDELRRLLFAERWQRGNDMKRKVLDIAVKEINKLGDISVTYELIKEGRKFSEVRFDITQKDVCGRLSAWARISEVIDGQMTLEGQEVRK
jgi:plasmid replication initiation protein